MSLHSYNPKVDCMALAARHQSLVVRPCSLHRVARARVVVARAAMDDFTSATKINFTLDASANGCTGMYWRSKPDMNASVSAPDWPRNGAKLQVCNL